MPIEHETRDGHLVWIRNPITGAISYVVDVRGKSFAFTLSGHQTHNPETSALSAEAIRRATAECPFCPGNEELTTRELMHVGAADIPGWSGRGAANDRWVIRVINNLFPRIPAELTANRNESYIVIEDPRHFVDEPHSNGDLIWTGQLGEAHFIQVIRADVWVMRRAFENPAVRSVVVRKNQGRESGASQPHIHQQIIGSPEPFPAVAAEAVATRANPGLWEEVIALVDRLGLVLERREGVVSYASPIGAFPRSYDVVMQAYRGLLSDLSDDAMRAFAVALYRILRILGPLPLDYEIHQGEGLPLHAHINARLYPYSNVAGTLNLPNTLLESAAAIRKALARGHFEP